MAKTKQAFTLTDDERRALAREIRYEADALPYSYQATRPPAPPPLDCLLLEAFLVHWRNLWYFFLEPRGHNQNVIASDYIPDWNPRKPDFALKKRIHATLAHISKGRIGARALTAKDVQIMRDHIANLWVEFDRGLRSDQRSWFDANPLKHKFPVEYRGPKPPLSGCCDR